MMSSFTLKADELQVFNSKYKDSVESFYMQHKIRKTKASNSTRVFKLAYGVFRASWMSNLAIGKVIYNIFEHGHKLSRKKNTPVSTIPKMPFVESRIGFSHTLDADIKQFAYSVEYGLGSKLMYEDEFSQFKQADIFIYPYVAIKI